MALAERPLALTLGDPAGIGPDITLLAWSARNRERVPPFVLIGDEAVLAARAKMLGLSVPIATVDEPGAASVLFAAALPVLPVSVPAQVVAGRPDKEAMEAVKRSIELGVSLARQGAVRAIVTNPVSKAMLYGAGFAFPGHTEYLAALAASDGQPPHPVMMLASGAFRVVPVTIHIPLKDVAGALREELIRVTIETTARDLGRFFGLERPRLAVSGLNPHAGEDGTLGREEIDMIAPAIATARAKGLDVAGPYPADTLFHDIARQSYDAAICMYHDQALVPFKTLAFEEGVNVTLGLPFVRTSPDHGTAFDIAGTGRASPLSLIEALRLADAMSRMAKAGAARAVGA
jgi:4-hydroxythreonine-4-phosphate dehydrogenase